MPKISRYGVPQRRFNHYQPRDKHAICRDCDANFTITTGQQDYFNERGLTLPVRCEKCRTARRTQPSISVSANSSIVMFGRQVLGAAQALQRDVDAILRPTPAAPNPPNSTTPALRGAAKPPVPIRDITCAGCGQAAQIPARSKKRKHAKCQGCWKADIDAWRKRADRRKGR